jgi:hypothetical protein
VLFAPGTPPPTVLVDGGRFAAAVRPDGGFAVHDVPAGAHRLEVVAAGPAAGAARYHPATVTISLRDRGKVRVRGGADGRTALPYPLVLEPAAGPQPEFFEAREGLSWSIITGNWSTLIMVGSMLMMFICPKLLNAVDPDAMKEMQEQMAQESGKGGMLGMLNPGGAGGGDEDSD